MSHSGITYLPLKRVSSNEGDTGRGAGAHVHGLHVCVCVCRTDGMLWALHRQAFKSVLQRGNEPRPVLKTLRNVEVLQCLSNSQMQQMSELMQEVRAAG